MELLLTFEEYCSEDGMFAKQGEHGSAYKDVFGKVSARRGTAGAGSLAVWAGQGTQPERSQRCVLPPRCRCCSSVTTRTS